MKHPVCFAVSDPPPAGAGEPRAADARAPNCFSKCSPETAAAFQGPRLFVFKGTLPDRPAAPALSWFVVWKKLQEAREAGSHLKPILLPAKTGHRPRLSGLGNVWGQDVPWLPPGPQSPGEPGGVLITADGR